MEEPPDPIEQARTRSIRLAAVLVALAVAIGVSLVVAPPGRPWFQPLDDRWRDLVVAHRDPWLTTVARATRLG